MFVKRWQDTNAAQQYVVGGREAPDHASLDISVTHMDPNWNDAVPSWRKRKTPHRASSGRAATASTGQVRQWATVPRHAEDTTPRTGSAMRNSLSTPGLATVGLGKFNIGALHEVIQQPDSNHDLEQGDDFFPGGLGVPDSFQGAGAMPTFYTDNTHPVRTYCCVNTRHFG